MTDDATIAAIEAARAHVGQPPDDEKVAPYPVNEAMVVHWVRAFEETNPVYTDPEVAAASRHGGVVAPPAMLGSWTLEISAGKSGSARDRVFGVLDDAGYTAVVATDYEHDYLREVRPGDHLYEEISIESLSDVKTTALGEGYFVTVRHDYKLLGSGEAVGVARMRLLKFRPPPAKPKAGQSAVSDPGSPRRPRPPINRDNAFFWEGVEARELRIQRCAACGTLRHPPRPMCGACGATERDTVTSAGRGTIHSYVVHHHPPLPGTDPPFAVAVIDLDEGVRFVSEIVDIDPAEVTIGMAVELTWREVEPDYILPLFAPALGQEDDA
ncbi:MAG: OB-fold domain-containing protein [Actinobacteria bacterium]|nr:OB-fold domain-containing protein [Actinomycetota bacterium]